ncbi:hypothetical protein QL285_051492 [Trifolium repens]|nr:hypothetical protein QL285_051492 [Trifolium repens]
MSRRGFGGCCWCIVGEFNSVRESSERRGVGQSIPAVYSQEMLGFDEFIEDLELIDLPLVGRRFTWFHPNGVSMSRLDRVLVSNDWVTTWGNPNVWVLPRDVSDHCPLVVRYSNLDWGPIPFRFNNFWLGIKSFKELIVKTWEAQSYTGWMGHILKDRFKGLKIAIKDWSVEVYGKPEEKRKELIEKILSLDVRSENGGISDTEVAQRKQLFVELWTLLKSIDSMFFNRARSKWLKEGDSNSKYFHSYINARRRGNSIVTLRTLDGWVDGPVHVREAIMVFFQNHYHSENWNRPILEGVLFLVLTDDTVDMLEDIFTGEEIFEVVQSCDGSKSPGPDEFTFAFIKEFWWLMRNDMKILFDQFHGNECIPKCLTSYFLTLIPKIKLPQCLGDFRPISLLGCVYKLIAKVLTARLAKVMDPLIAKTQKAFLKNHQLVEGVVVVNEVIDYAKKTGKDCLILKVDFEKAYDSLIGISWITCCNALDSGQNGELGCGLVFVVAICRCL